MFINPNVINAIEPPIAEAQSWISGRSFPEEKPLINLAQAVPSYPPAQSLQKHLATRTRLFQTAQYTEIAGIPELRSSLSTHMNKVYKGNTSLNNVLISSGCNQAYCLTIMTLAKAGDEIILPEPYYFNHLMWLEMLGIKAKLMPFKPDQNGIPTPLDAERLLTKKTKAIVLISPNNPTGAIYPPDIITSFYEFAREKEIALIIDETYKDFLGSIQPHSLFQKKQWEETFIQIYSFSKVFSLTGYRVGSIIAGEKIIQSITKIMDTLAICAPRISQDAALFGLANLSNWVSKKQKIIKERCDFVQGLFQSKDINFEVVSCGAYFAYIKHPFVELSARQVAMKLAKQANILCLPGTFFGPNQEHFLRFAFANASIEEMTLVEERLRQYYD
tara:strand:- start:779 stop:1945 length:1167 start_codon:yes stop_codon:yes gene_type:complete